MVDTRADRLSKVLDLLRSARDRLADVRLMWDEDTCKLYIEQVFDISFQNALLKVKAELSEAILALVEITDEGGGKDGDNEQWQHESGFDCEDKSEVEAYPLSSYRVAGMTVNFFEESFDVDGYPEIWIGRKFTERDRGGVCELVKKIYLKGQSDKVEEVVKCSQISLFKILGIQ